MSFLRRFLELTRPTWVRCFILIIVGIAVRFPALSGEFIWDDAALVRDNPFTKSPLLITETFRHYLELDGSSAHYRPVQNISYFFDYAVWNGEAYGYHVSNLLWHVAAGILLYFLLRQLLGALESRWRVAGVETSPKLPSSSSMAFLVALVWLIHPVHSAAVDYISGRADSVAAFFACGSWLIYLRARETGKRVASFALYALAGSLCLLALASRESACIWLLIFLVHLFAFDRGTSLRAKFCCLATTLALVGTYAALRHLPHVQAQAEAGSSTPLLVRVVLMFRALGDYGRLLFFPVNLHMERTLEAPGALLGNAGWREAISREYLSLGGLVVAAALCLGAFHRGRARVVRAFGAVWFLVAFLPISNLISLNATVAEHWLYLPSIGFLLFVSGCVLELPASGRRLIPAAALIAVIALGARSIDRSRDWVSAEAFYSRSLAAGGAKPRMALNLGLILLEKGEYAKAESLLRRMVRVYPDYPIASNALAHALFHQGKLDEARKYFLLANEAAERTRQQHPKTWVAALDFARMQYREHDVQGAIATARKAVADYPGTWQLVSFESELLRASEGPAAALPVVEAFARDNWWHSEAALTKGKLYSEQGSDEKAEAAFYLASRLDIHSVEGLNLMALLQLRRNRLEDAWKTQRQAVARQPDQPRQYLLLSDILRRMGRTEDARAAMANVDRLHASIRGGMAVN